MAKVEDIRSILSDRERLAGMPLGDYLEIWGELEREEEIAIFSALSLEDKVDLLGLLPPGSQELLVTDLSSDHLRVLLEEMEPDDLTDFIQSVSPEVRQAVWRNLSDEAREETKFLLRFDEDDAAGIMTPRYLAVARSLTVAQAIAWVRKHAEEAEIISQLYVLDKLKRLTGAVFLKKLLAAADEQRVSEIVEDRPISVRQDTDQEEVARILETYDLAALPVVDGHDRLLGVVTFDDVFDVIRQEQTEDVYRMGALGGGTEPYLESSVFDLVKKRIPWLGILLLAATLTTNVLASFESLFLAAAVLTLFIPTIIGTGGNSSTQASTQIIRGLATGEIHVRDIGRVMAKEILVGLLLGVAMGALIFARSLVLPPPIEWHQAATVGIALVFVVVFATTVGAFSPLVIRAVGIDPTVVAAPVMATLIDVAGLTIYFLVARALLGL